MLLSLSPRLLEVIMWNHLSRALLLLSLSLPALATPPNTPILDGRPIEYDDQDPQAAYTGGGGAFGAGSSIKNLYVTWDETYLYVALQGTEVDNKLVVMLDVDPGAGTGATTTTNWTGVTPGYIQYNDVGWVAATNVGAVPFGLDYQVASEGFYNNVIQILYDGSAVPDSNTVAVLFDEGNGASPRGTPVDMAVQSDDTICDLKGFEARIPWSVLYPSTGDHAERFGVVESGETVPRGASLRLFAAIHNNNPSSAYSANDAIPEQVSANALWTNGILTTDTYLDVLVDADDDGIPDVDSGDVNAPFIRAASGVQNSQLLFVQFNEAIDQLTAEQEDKWTVDGVPPASVEISGTDAVLLHLTNALPAAGTTILIAADGVEDVSNNARLTEYCFSPAASGLTNAMTVRFVLETASGLGINPGASNFFINGGSAPIEFGYPPAVSSPLQVLSGTLYYRDVVFPPGTAQQLNYKYSGQLTTTGTNTYEAVRLTDYEDATRKLTLPLDVSSLVVTDYLGAAAGPYRVGATGAADLYLDAQRGDAGVRERTTILFQVDLSARNRNVIKRVLVQGSDPLRGFNSTSADVPDWAGGVGWEEGGLGLFDDGTHGDEVADDGIYSRLWSFTPDGTDEELTEDYPYSLVGGSLDTYPYNGNWETRRSYRSAVYKFYVVKTNDDWLESPNSNLEIYLEDPLVTNIVLDPFVWANEGLPPPPPSNSPTMGVIEVLSGGVQRVHFENLPGEAQHGLLISTNLDQGWMDFGTRATGTNGLWHVDVQNANPSAEFYAAFAGPAEAPIGIYFEPNPLPSTGGVLSIWYRQLGRSLAGARDVGLTGDWNGWNVGVPMEFLGDGVWYYELATTNRVQFKARTVSGAWEGGDNTRAYIGEGRATWSPARPVAGGSLDITYNAAGGPLAASTSVVAHLGFDDPWFGISSIPMSNTTGTLWETSITVATNAILSVNFVFKNPQETIWDSEGNEGNGGRLYRAFLDPYPY